METSAFKSTSRRVAPEPKASKQPASLRRSHSVNAVSRKTHLPFEDSNSISSEFSVRRDNPLFWTSSSSPPEKEEEVSLRNGETKPSYSSNHLKERGSGSSVSEVRGRSVTRNGNVRNGLVEVCPGCGGGLCPGRMTKEFTRVKMRWILQHLQMLEAEIKKEQITDGMNRINSARNRVDTRGRVKIQE